MFTRKNETEELLLSINKNCATFFGKTKTKPQGTLECKLTQTREAFAFTPSIPLGREGAWLIGLTSLEVYLSLFLI